MLYQICNRQLQKIMLIFELNKMFHQVPSDHSIRIMLCLLGSKVKDEVPLVPLPSSTAAYRRARPEARLFQAAHAAAPKQSHG